MEQKIYYSRAKHLTIAISHGELKEIAGQTVRTNERYAVFSDNGDKFGIFRTSDKDVIEALDRRVEEVGDIYTPEQYAKISIPVETRNVMLERQLEEANRLIAELKTGKGASAAKPVNAEKK